MTPYDVLVVGAGPAGATAATTAARGGLRVGLLDRAAFPRYKTCGGGLIGPTLAHLPTGPGLPVREQVHHADLTLRGGRARTRSSAEPLVATVVRSELDQWLADLAVAAGVDFRHPCTVRSIDQDAELVTVQTDAGPLQARMLIGADGTSGRVGRYVGVDLQRVDLGLEVEVRAAGTGTRWAGRIHLDWGPIPGSYAWVFPKGDLLTVGVIAARGRPEDTRRYLRDVVRTMGLERQEVVLESGHLTRTRTPGSPLARGRVVVVGDAAGLLEPWTREGISFAVRSGIAAGQTALDHLDAPDPGVHHAAALGVELLPEMAAGEACLRAFERHPEVFHALISRTPFGWREFCRLTRGDTTLARAQRHLPVRAMVAALG